MTGGRGRDSSASTATPFPEELLSGYLDGALTQQEEQQVRLHLERSPEARAMLEELAALRPGGAQHSVRAGRGSPVERGAAHARLRDRDAAGYRAARARAVSVSPFVLVWQASHAPFGTEMKRGMIWWGAGLWLSGLGGALLVFLSVLGDRLSDRRHDRYRRVLK